MKLKVVVCWLFVTIGLILPFSSNGAETAQARIWCWSLHFQQGRDSFGDTLDLSTVSGTPNGELAPFNGPQYVSGFALDSSGFPITGTLYLNLPPAEDNNHNGWPDFFEVSQAVTAVTTGTYSTGLSSGTISATWNRDAASKDGVCSFDLTDDTFGSLGQYRLAFELLEYTGPLSYVAGSNVVNGSVNLTKSGDVSSLLQGSVQFVKSSTAPLDRLQLQPGFWTNAESLTLSFTNSLFLRDQTGWPTNYYGDVIFDDGDPSTAAPDYTSWMLSIDDANDANQNGIPDFSDTPQATPRQPQLALTLTSTNLQLILQGDLGTTCQIQQSPGLPAASWQTTQTLTLTNVPQAISLPFPNGPAAFWRVQVQ